MMSDVDADATRDASMIASAQKVEHYEIASYGSARTWANLLGKTEVASLLEETLDEEKETDQRLTSIAESMVNSAAARGGEEEEEEESSARGRSSRARSIVARGSRHAAPDRRRR